MTRPSIFDEASTDTGELASKVAEKAPPRTVAAANASNTTVAGATADELVADEATKGQYG